MAEKIKQTVATSDEDRAFLAEFERHTEHLYGMVIEMLTTERTTLLSPLFRNILLEKAETVKSYHIPLRNRLAADNLGDNLKPYKGQ